MVFCMEKCALTQAWYVTRKLLLTSLLTGNTVRTFFNREVLTISKEGADRVL
jgi:hypothetical protein